MTFLPISLLLRVLSFSIYVSAFVVTARLVRQLILGENPGWAIALRFLRSRLFRVSYLTAAMFVLMLALTAGMTSLFTSASIFEAIRNHFSPNDIAMITVVIASAVIAWLMVPFGFRLISDGSVQSLPRRQVWFGRIAAFAAAAICIIELHFIRNIAQSINFAIQEEPWIRTNVVWPAVSILGEIPFAMLSVILGSIVFEQYELPPVPSPS